MYCIIYTILNNYSDTDSRHIMTRGNTMNALYLLPNAEQEVIDSYDEDIMVTNRDGIIIKATHISGQQYGLAAKELLGQSVYELEAKGIFAPAITPPVLKQKKKVVLVQKTSTDRKVLITGIPLFNDKHEVEFVVSYSYDVSELLVLQDYLQELEGEISRVKGELTLLREKSLSFDGIISESRSMKQIMKTITKIAPLQVPVILQGENGVGKSTLAKLIHKQSTFRDGPFIEVNCATIPEAILEYELMGNLSSEASSKVGYMQMARSGTLYLQGVDELSLASQTTLLKAIQQHQGNFRIISSTEIDLEELMAEKHFREDLYYLLHVVPIQIEPLRERLEDLSKVIEKYLGKFCASYQVTKTLSDDLYHELLHLEWSGNHLEVKNLLERLVVQSESSVITKDDLPIEYRRRDADLNTLEIEGRTLPKILEKRNVY